VADRSHWLFNQIMVRQLDKKKLESRESTQIKKRIKFAKNKIILIYWLPPMQQTLSMQLKFRSKCFQFWINRIYCFFFIRIQILGISFCSLYSFNYLRNVSEIMHSFVFVKGKDGISILRKWSFLVIKRQRFQLTLNQDIFTLS
jgi:hypothetical protein